MFFYGRVSYRKKKIMGIRCLNRFIQNRCVNASFRVHLKEFTGKRIAVDTSIYMYRYSGEGALLENMYLMGSVFRHYNIHAVFVFDGPPPPQKTDLIELRRKKKEEAKRQYDTLAKIVKEKKEEVANNISTSITTTEIDDLTETMRELKKQFVRLRDCDISSVKELLVSFGFATIDAEGEADALCANLSLKRRVDACLSDDTDMFVYGCPVVLRNISLLNHSVISYNTSEILKSLSLTQQEFKMMCVVCGTDYSNINSSHSPDSVYRQLMKFKALPHKDQAKYHDSGGGFYDWYASQPRKSTKAEKEKEGQTATATATASTIRQCDSEVSAITYISNEAMFDVSTISNGKPYKQLVVLNRENIQKQRIIEIMTKEDFIFIDSSPSDETIIKSLSTGKSSLTESPVYGICVQSPEEQATLIAKEVYGVEDVSSFKELHIVRKQMKRRNSNTE